MSNSINVPEYEVSEFNKAIKEIIENNFDYIRIKGEISEIKTATRGQLYLTLKDSGSILSCVIWEQKKKYLKFIPELGMEVIVTGKITTWAKYKTTYQLDIDNIEIGGEGALLKLIEDRKKKLKEMGLFEQKNKKSIPYLPNKIGLITSPTGSVLHDIINRIKDRFPLPIDIWPVFVQGSESVTSIIKAIHGFNLMKTNEKPDIIIIARGGGSTEDLMAFNDENLAIKVFESNIPIISAIGHETDTTIIDYVSDLRASTPTAAAEKAVPIKLDLIENLKMFDQRLNFLIKNKFNNNYDYYINLIKFIKAPKTVINFFQEKLKKNIQDIEQSMMNKIQKNLFFLNSYTKIIKPPLELLKFKKTVLMNSVQTLQKTIDNNLMKSNKNFDKFNRLLNANSVSFNLKKGYSILYKSNKIVKNTKILKEKETIKAKLFKGYMELRIKKIN